jgi:FkbM family methyltransferase
MDQYIADVLNLRSHLNQTCISQTMISFKRLYSFLLKPAAERRTTARFMTTMWFAKFSYAPHRVRLIVGPTERLKFWWSYFPANFSVDRGMFDYWGDDVGELRFLWKYLKPGMTFLDIGAFHGIYSVIAARRLGAGSRVVAFEPSPRERRRLRLHLRYNGINAVVVEPYAVAAEGGEAALTVVGDGYQTMNSLRSPAVDHHVQRQQIVVQTIALDEYLCRNQIDNVDFMKIDAEGGEIQIFNGAKTLLSRLRPLIICEVLDKVTRPWGYPAREIVERLHTYDYGWFEILPDGSLLPHHPRNEYPEEVRNFLAVPHEKQKDLQYNHFPESMVDIIPGQRGSLLKKWFTYQDIVSGLNVRRHWK